MFDEFDRNFAVKMKSLNEYEDPEDEAAHDPMKDLEIFSHVYKSTYGDLKKKHRETINTVRTREFDTFRKVASRGGEGSHAYNKINAEVANIKDKILKAQKAKNFLQEDFMEAIDKKAMTFRDFYKAQQSSDDEDSDDSNASSDSLRKTLGKKWDLFEGQLKKVMG